jgi:dihydropteroate synthase
VAEVTEFLRARCRAALEAGIERSRLWIDPGIGFGKRLEHNLDLLRRLEELRSLGLPVCLGVSRKAFVADVEARAGCARSAPDARLGGTLAALVVGVQTAPRSCACTTCAPQAGGARRAGTRCPDRDTGAS